MWREWTKKRGQQRRLHLDVERSKKERSKKIWKELVECSMIVRGLQRLDPQDCARWTLGYKNRLKPVCRIIR